MTASATVEAYWMPGCSSCLRMKEFIERSGRPFTASNVDADEEARRAMAAAGLVAPAARVGERWVSGVDLAAVAELIGVAYEPLAILPPSELAERYLLNLDVAEATIAQLTDRMLAHRLPDRARPMLDVATQVAQVMRAFLDAYDLDRHTASEWYAMSDDVRTRDDVLERLHGTRERFASWWRDDGVDDPLDRVVATYWGYPTLLEVLEREVWHTTQHLRQLQHVLRVFGVEPVEPLTARHLDGLPLPEGVHD